MSLMFDISIMITFKILFRSLDSLTKPHSRHKHDFSPKSAQIFATFANISKASDKPRILRNVAQTDIAQSHSRVLNMSKLYGGKS